MNTLDIIFEVAGSRLYRDKHELAEELGRVGCYPVGSLWFLDLPEEDCGGRARRFVIHTKKVRYTDGTWYRLWLELADSPKCKGIF